ncbi:helix-turn-helix transcriptional regulator [Olivibacter sp. SDN3]|uniref:helix-turn-helix domain-containing protein n=1 Tax=Olivibacter sp. SDN3 TaxID=2764720 RepID=UPI001651929F|nr:helix-turn-helix transcriptional regulator [Olivibacter sp. SDN3]QNL50731.1 helix-turn-helix transcriptional regulator [Olivibacter sp. SDN3]
MDSKAVIKAKIVASNIKKLREYRNYTQLYMAEKLGISQNAYSKMELGYSKISLDKLFSIAAALEIPHTELLLNCEEDVLLIRSLIPFTTSDKKHGR